MKPSDVCDLWTGYGIYWPREKVPETKLVHLECEQAETTRAHAALTQSQRDVVVQMRTAKDREEAFRCDLIELLAKHGAELNITDDGRGYGMHGGIAEITMMSEWDSDGNPTADYTEFRI